MRTKAGAMSSIGMKNPLELFELQGYCFVTKTLWLKAAAVIYAIFRLRIGKALIFQLVN